MGVDGGLRNGLQPLGTSAVHPMGGGVDCTAGSGSGRAGAEVAGGAAEEVLQPGVEAEHWQQHHSLGQTFT